MSIADRIKLVGMVRIYDIPHGLDRKYGLPILFDSHNVITDDGLNRSAQLIGGISTDAIDKMSIGDRGINPSDINTALAPDPSDTALSNELIEKDIGTKSVTSNVLTMSTTFLTSEGPFPFSVAAQKIVNEYGLKTSDGVLIARKTFASIPFSVASRTGIIVEWRITLL